jgi:hypothetical protein
MDDSNSGIAAGRACWVVTGTRCEGTVSGPFEVKINTCQKCAFYHRVAVEEGLDLEPHDKLLVRYRSASPEPAEVPGR